MGIFNETFIEDIFDPDEDEERTPEQKLAEEDEARKAENERIRAAAEKKGHFIDPTRAISAEEKDFTRGLSHRINTVQERDAPVAARTTLGAAERFGGTQVAANERSAGAQLGPAAQGTATLGTAAGINRGEDQQFRAGQVGLANALAQQAAGKGPSLAAGQLRQATDRNIKQQMAVAAAGGGNAAMAQRGAAMGAAQANQQAGRDAAQMRIQEQMSAQQQLAGVLQGGRTQDLAVAQNQAALQQQMGMANMDASNKFGLANMDARNQYGLKGAELAQQNMQFNAGQTNAYNQNQATFSQQAGLANQNAGNQFLLAQGQLDQQTAFANQQAYLANQGQTDASISNLLGMQEADLTRARQNAQQYDIMQANERVRQGTIAAQQAQAQAQREAAYIGAGASMVGSIVGGISGGSTPNNPSDERSKFELKPLDSPTITTSQGGGFDPDAPTIATSQGGGFDPDAEGNASRGKMLGGFVGALGKFMAAPGAAKVEFTDPTAGDMKLQFASALSKQGRERGGY